MNREYTSNLLHHFVGSSCPLDDGANFQTLEAVLRAGAVSFGPDFPARTTFAYSYNSDVAHILGGGLIVPEVTCYADIPIDCLGLHIGKYGRFGISFTRAFVVKNGGRPVSYIPLQSSDYRSGWGSIHTELMVKEWIAKWRGFERYSVEPRRRPTFMTKLGVEPENDDDAILAMNGVFAELLCFVKVFDSDLPESDPHNYYMEREWRIANALPFEFKDIAKIFLPTQYREPFATDFPFLTDRLHILE